MTKIECPSCTERTLPFVQSEAVCENCHECYDAAKLKDIWLNTFSGKIRQIEVFHVLKNYVFCSTCYKESLIFHNGLNLWMCFCCYRTWKEHQLKYCEYCKMHKHTHLFHRIGVCNSCWKYYMNYEKYKPSKSPPEWLWKNFDFNKDKIFW